MALHVGVSGHRDLRSDGIADLRRVASALFAAIRAEVLAVHREDQVNPTSLYQPEPPKLRCLCGVAEGADAILAEAALSEGWDLVALLPFAPAEYAKDFAGPALNQHRCLLARADSVCSLDGDRADGTAYSALGEQIVEHADLLLAVWDKLPPRGPGGTGEVVQLALRRGLPVAVVPLSASDVPDWLGGNPGNLAGIVRAALLPPPSVDGFPQAYFAERSHGAGWASSAVRLYENLVTFGFPRPTPAPKRSTPEQHTVRPLDQAFVWADRLAAEHAARYRAAALMRYGLIIPATVASLFGWYGNGWQQAAGNLADFAVLVFIVRFSARGWWEPSHTRFTAYRALAEYLRNAELLAALGAVARIPGAAAHQEKAMDWTAWYDRALVRQEGLPTACFGPKRSGMRPPSSGTKRPARFNSCCAAPRGST